MVIVNRVLAFKHFHVRLNLAQAPKSILDNFTPIWIVGVEVLQSQLGTNNFFSQLFDNRVVNQFRKAVQALFNTRQGVHRVAHTNHGGVFQISGIDLQNSKPLLRNSRVHVACHQAFHSEVRYRQLARYAQLSRAAGLLRLSDQPFGSNDVTRRP